MIGSESQEAAVHVGQPPLHRRPDSRVRGGTGLSQYPPGPSLLIGLAYFKEAAIPPGRFAHQHMQQRPSYATSHTLGPGGQQVADTERLLLH
jgi:hypothetical protein